MLALILLTAAGTLVLAGRSAGARNPLSARHGIRGTVSLVATAGRTEIVVRGPSGSLLTVSSPRIVTSDGYALAAGDVRPGDTVAVWGNRVTDLSQSWVSRQGLVAAAPDPLNASMVVQLTSSQQILVDLNSTTLINGLAASRASPALIMDAYRVQVSGIFDAQLDEMTQTASVTYSAV